MGTSSTRETYEALCCVCGTLRTCASTYYGRILDTERQYWWSRLRGLKCATCRQWTKHAPVGVRVGLEEAERRGVDKLHRRRAQIRALGELTYREIDVLDEDPTLLSVEQTKFDGSWHFEVAEPLPHGVEYRVLRWILYAIDPDRDDRSSWYENEAAHYISWGLKPNSGWMCDALQEYREAWRQVRQLEQVYANQKS